MQPVQPGRSRDRFVSLPDEFQGEQQPGQLPETTPTIFEVRQHAFNAGLVHTGCCCRRRRRSCSCRRRRSCCCLTCRTRNVSYLERSCKPCKLPPSAVPQDLPEEAGTRGRITVYCVAESIDRKVGGCGAAQQASPVACHPFHRHTRLCCTCSICCTGAGAAVTGAGRRGAAAPVPRRALRHVRV